MGPETTVVRAQDVLRRSVHAGALALLLGLTQGSGAAAAADPLIEALRQRVETIRTVGDAQLGAGSAGARELVASLYERRGFAPLWTDPQRADALLTTLEASTAHGLDPRDYHVNELAASDLAASASGAVRLRAQVRRELLLTDAFVRLAYHLHFGKADPRRLNAAWNFARTLEAAEPVAALEELVQRRDPATALEGLAPRLPMYRDLRRALEQLRRIERSGGWGTVAAGPALELDSKGDRVVQLRQRLRASSDLAPSTSESSRFDAVLLDAVRRFQSRHGLEVDGVVGRATLAALNVSVRERIAQVRANLDRLRWVARELAGDFLLVDIADFTAQLWLNDSLTWSSRVVVGRPFRTTPAFRAQMKYLVLNPEWNVPPTILREDLLPKVIDDLGYLQRHDMRVVDHGGASVDRNDIAWPQYRQQPRAFPFQIVQAPGSANPLGQIKFMFPNEHAVYLHDTPSRRLFEHAVRAFSSGCIRIENPLKLAQLLLDDPRQWSEAQLRDAIASGRTQTIPVRHAVPVLLLYFTATAGADGELQFRPDLYRRDAAVIAALAAPFRFAPIETRPQTRGAR